MDPEGALLGAAIQELWAIGRRLDELSARKAPLMAAVAVREERLAALDAALRSPESRHRAALATRSSAQTLEQATAAQIYAGQPPLLYLQDRESHIGSARMAPLPEDHCGAPPSEEATSFVGFEPAYPTNIAGVGGVLGPRSGIPLRLRPVKNCFRTSDELVRGLRTLAPADPQGASYFSRPVVSPDDEHDDVTHLQAVRNIGLYAAAPLLPLASAPVGPSKTPARQRQFSVVGVSKAAEEAFEFANIERLVADLNDDGPPSAAEPSSGASAPPRGRGPLAGKGGRTAGICRLATSRPEAGPPAAGASAFDETCRAVGEMMASCAAPTLERLRRASADRNLRLRRALAVRLETQVICLRWQRPDRPLSRPVDKTLDLLCKHRLSSLPGFAASSLRLMNRNRRHGAAWEGPAPVRDSAPGPETPRQGAASPQAGCPQARLLLSPGPRPPGTAAS